MLLLTIVTSSLMEMPDVVPCVLLKVIRPLLLEGADPNLDVPETLWIGPNRRAADENFWSNQVGRATLALANIRMLPLQLRRLFITYGLQLLPVIYNMTSEEAVAMIAALCRTAPEHVKRYYSLNQTAENRVAVIDDMMDHEEGMDPEFTQEWADNFEQETEATVCVFILQRYSCSALVVSGLISLWALFNIDRLL